MRRDWTPPPLFSPNPPNQSLQSTNMSSTSPGPSVCCQTIRHGGSIWLSLLIGSLLKGWFFSGRPTLPTSPPPDKTQSAAAFEEQICKLDLFAPDRVDKSDGMHGCVWWERPRRIVDLWWPVFCMKVLLPGSGLSVPVRHNVKISSPTQHKKAPCLM